MARFNKAIKTLEFDKVAEMLADSARTEGAKALARTLMPETDALRVKRMQADTAAAKFLIMKKGNPSFGDVSDISDAVERAQKKATLIPKELLDIANVMRTARLLSDYARDDTIGETALTPVFSRLSVNRFLEEKITRAILSEDMIADEASPALADIRRKMRSAQGKVRETLQKFVSGSYGKYLQENIVTVRNGRYVVPVKVEYKNEIKGFVHDTSATGATVFIEPYAVLEANNELRELEIKESREIEKVLFELSAECAAFGGTIYLNYLNITQLALVFAKADLALKTDSCEPTVLEDGRSVIYKGARHPLISPSEVVKVDISLGREFDTMVITGPNTGGKTVTLKTLGLFSIMAQCGMQLPCDSAEISMFEDILADIGDEQSIEQSLSTFSAHMTNIVNILGNVTDGCMVLFDELGAGTDPIEGAAIAISVIEEVREYGALCAATTHYSELKEFALNTEGVVNAGCEFDVETLRPTYRLITGTPGRSNAFAISEKLGLSKGVIERADRHIKAEDRRMEEIIAGLDEKRVELEKQMSELNRRKREFDTFEAEKRKYINELTSRTQRDAQNLRDQAVRMVESAKASAAFVFDKLDKLQKQSETERTRAGLESARADIRRELRGFDESASLSRDSIAEEEEEYVLPRPLKVGDDVLICSIGKRGVVQTKPNKDGDLTVRAGIISMRTNISNLRLIEEKKSQKEKKPKGSVGKQLADNQFKMQIDLRGMIGDEAWFAVDKYIDQAILANVSSVTLLHGKGTGALRNALWQQLKRDKRVESFRPGEYGEGDYGVTVVTIKTVL